MLSVNNQFKFKVGEINGYDVSLEKKGGELSIYSGVNILEARYGFQDINEDSKADGYIFTEAAAEDILFSFMDNLQVMEAVDASTITVKTSVIFPVAGAKLRLRVSSGTSEIVTISAVQCKSFAGATLLNATANINNNIDFITPAGTYKIDIFIVSETVVATNDLIDFILPYLGIQEYTGA